jgi:hypothetical protein
MSTQINVEDIPCSINKGIIYANIWHLLGHDFKIILLLLLLSFFPIINKHHCMLRSNNLIIFFCIK